MCKARRAAGKTRRAQRQNRLEAEEESNTDLSVLKVKSPQSTYPITVTVEVNNRDLSLDIVTGAAVSIISQETQKKWSHWYHKFSRFSIIHFNARLTSL